MKFGVFRGRWHVGFNQKDIITSNESTLNYFPLKCFSLKSKLVLDPSIELQPK